METGSTCCTVKKTCKIVLRVEYHVTYEADSVPMEEPLLRETVKDVLMAVPLDSATFSRYGTHRALRESVQLMAVEGKDVPARLAKPEYPPDDGGGIPDVDSV